MEHLSKIQELRRISPAIAVICGLWYISIDLITVVAPHGDKDTQSLVEIIPCSTRPQNTCPTSLIKYTFDIGILTRTHAP